MAKFAKWAAAAVIAAALAAGAFTAAVNIWMCSKFGARIVEKEEAAGCGAECVIVLGCKAYSDGRLSLMLRDRMDAAIELYEAGAAEKLLLSGAQDLEKNYDEVTAMHDYAVSKGVPEEAIDLDALGVSTEETMRRAKSEYGIGKAVVVTQRYHLYRALFAAERSGIEAVGCSALEVRYPGQLYRDLREVIARASYFLGVTG